MELTVKSKVLESLQLAGLKVMKEDGKYIHLEHEYLIEIENESLFKLSHEGYVVAPFGKLEELIGFIMEDQGL